MSCRLVKEQMGNGKSQETLDSVGLQTSSEKGAEEEEEEEEEPTGEGNYSSKTQNNQWDKLFISMLHFLIRFDVNLMLSESK